MQCGWISKYYDKRKKPCKNGVHSVPFIQNSRECMLIYSYCQQTPNCDEGWEEGITKEHKGGDEYADCLDSSYEYMGMLVSKLIKLVHFNVCSYCISIMPQ